MVTPILFIFLMITPEALAQEDYNGTLEVYVEGADGEHEYTLCGGELSELNIGCLSFEGKEFVEGYYGEFPYKGDKKVKLYGCAIDETADNFNCDAITASPITKTKSMTLLLNQASKMALPTQLSGSNIETGEIGSEDKEVSAENSDEEDDDNDDLPQDGGCQGEDDYCDRDEGCRSESVDCIDDRNFDEDDYNG